MRPNTKSGGGGGGGVQFASGPMKRGGGGGQFASGPVRKVGAFVWRTGNTLSLIINGYNFGRGGCSSTWSTLSGYATGYVQRLLLYNIFIEDYNTLHVARKLHKNNSNNYRVLQY